MTRGLRQNGMRWRPALLLALALGLTEPPPASAACKPSQDDGTAGVCEPPARPSRRASRARAQATAQPVNKARAALAQARAPNYYSQYFGYVLLPNSRLMPKLPSTPYTFDVFAAQTFAVRWELAFVSAVLAIHGIKNWDWGSSSYHAQNEGFFGKNTAHGGMDKLGHAFSGMLLADILHARMVGQMGTSDNAAATASLLSFGAMAMIEVFDGFAKNHGFSYEDLIADGVGAIFSYLRNTVPGLREKIDYRVQWVPGKDSRNDPTTDYMNQKFLLALKLSGFEQLRPTAWRFVELHVGYFARGYGEGDILRGVPRERSLYAGIGLNLNELLLSDMTVRRSLPGNLVGFLFEHFQVPYTSINTNNER